MKILQLSALAGVFLLVGACSGTSSLGDDDETADEGGGSGGSGGTSGGGTSNGGASGSTMTGGRGGSTSMGGGTADPCAGRPCGALCNTCGTARPGDPATGGAGMGAPGIPCDIATAAYCGANGECSPAFPVCNNECE